MGTPGRELLLPSVASVASVASDFRLRTRAFLACLLAAVTCGVCYSQAIYSLALQKKYALSQSQIDTISVANTFVSPIVFVGGMLCDARGAKLTTIIGGVFMCAGLLTSYFVAELWPSHGSSGESANAVTALMSVGACVTQLGQSCVTSAAFTTPVRMFPERRGYVVGLLKAYAGLGAGLMAQLYIGISGHTADDSPSTLNFLIVVCAIVATVDIFVGPSMQPPQTFDYEESAERATKAESRAMDFRLFSGSLILLGLICSVFVVSILTDPGTNDAEAKSNAFVQAGTPTARLLAGVCLALLLANGAVFLPTEPQTCCSREREHPLSRTAPLLTPHDTNPCLGASEDDVPLRSLAFTVDGILLLVANVGIVSAGLVDTANAGQILESSGRGSASTAVSIFSATQACGRLFSGAASEQLLLSTCESRFHVTRPLFVALAAFLSAVGQFLLFLGPRGGSDHLEMLLYAGFAIGGFGFGMVWPLMVLITGERWGNKFIGGNYMYFDGMSTFCGGLLVGKILAQEVYAMHVPEGEVKCFGSSCFGTTHLVSGTLALVAACAALIFWLRSRALYNRICRPS